VRIKVHNLPLHAYGTATIEVPDGTLEEDMDIAICDAIDNGKLSDVEVNAIDGADINYSACNEWEFMWEPVSPNDADDLTWEDGPSVVVDIHTKDGKTTTEVTHSS